MRQKLIRFTENTQLENVIEPEKALYTSIKGAWAEYFGRRAPLTLEVGCGRGEYTTGLAEKFPDENFVGMDMKGDRLWHGAKHANMMGLRNVAFLRGHIELIERFFAPGEISNIWVTFPGPQAKKIQANRRLTNPKFLAIYHRLLSPGGRIFVKTDSDDVFWYTLDYARRTELFAVEVAEHDVYNSPLLPDLHGVQTQFEKQFLRKGKTIKYIVLRRKKALLPLILAKLGRRVKP